MQNLELIKKIRQETGASLADIKEALNACGNNYDEALRYIFKKGIAKAEKRSDRIARQGVIASYIHSNDRIGVLVEVNCETDFVAKNEEFRQFAHNVALQVCALSPLYLDETDVPESVKDEIKNDLVKIPKLASDPSLLEKEMNRKYSEFVSTYCLLKQKFFKDNSVTIEEMMKSLSGKLGEAIKIARFVRFEISS